MVRVQDAVLSFLYFRGEEGKALLLGLPYLLHFN